MGTATPLIADADTGFGGLINVRQTVRGYEAAGVQAIQIEDQEMPKKCGHTPNRRVIAAADMCRKIEVAVDARTSTDTLIIARTDARTGLGLTEAIRRGQDYAKAGADIVFVEAPESEDEFKRVGDEVDCWLLANMVPTGKSPVVGAEKLKSYRIQYRDLSVRRHVGRLCGAGGELRAPQEPRLDGRFAGPRLHHGAAS